MDPHYHRRAFCVSSTLGSQTELEAFVSPSSMEEQAAREAQASAEEHRRRLANRQRLRELRIKRLRAKVGSFGLRFASTNLYWLFISLFGFVVVNVFVVVAWVGLVSVKETVMRFF